MDSENKKRVIEEVAGTIVDVFEKGIIIQPDDENKGNISEAFDGRDYSKFQIGQRVLRTTYTWLRKADENDKKAYEMLGEECPEFVSEYDYVTEDEEEARLRKEAEQARRTEPENTDLGR